MDDEEQCATYVIYLPFASEEEERRGETGRASRNGPWVRGEGAGD
jgi:hypothetical protein